MRNNKILLLNLAINGLATRKKKRNFMRREFIKRIKTQNSR
jgi:hypothetical protein